MGLNWIDNSGRAIEETAQELISIVKYGQKSNPSVKMSATAACDHEVPA